MEQLLDQVAQALERIRTDVVGGIEEQVDTVMTKGWRLVSSLEAELTQLTEKRATLEMQAISQDHIGFLQVRHQNKKDSASCGRSFHLHVSVLTVGVSPELRQCHSSTGGGSVEQPRFRLGLFSTLPPGGCEKLPDRG